jgi:hypothetical protein
MHVMGDAEGQNEGMAEARGDEGGVWGAEKQKLLQGAAGDGAKGREGRVCTVVTTVVYSSEEGYLDDKKQGNEER